MGAAGAGCYRARVDENRSPEHEQEDAPPSTPFDNPFFLPVILAGFTVWFAYDGWFNPEMEWIRFNRYGALVAGAAALYTGFRAFRQRWQRSRD